MFKLLPYEEKDKETYLQLQISAFEKYIVEFFGKFDINVMLGHLDKLKDGLLKIVVEDKIAGFVYYKEDEDKITVDVFALFEEYRNYGLGSKVMNSFIEKSIATGKQIVLDTFKTNPARRFYERHGFAVVGENMSHYILSYNPNK